MKDHSVPNAAVTGFVSGVLMGSALGLLLAPASGKTTRARVSHRLRETAGSARELKERMNDRLRETAGSARELKKRMDRGLRETAENARGLKEKLRHRMRSAATALEPRIS